MRCQRCGGSTYREYDPDLREEYDHCSWCSWDSGYHAPPEYRREVMPRPNAHNTPKDYGALPAVCAHCGAPFLARQRADRTQRYCSRECGMQARLMRQKVGAQ